MPLTLTYLGPWPLRAKMSAKIGPRATGASLAAPGGLSVSVMMMVVVVSRTPPVVQEADTYLVQRESFEMFRQNILFTQ